MHDLSATRLPTRTHVGAHAGKVLVLGHDTRSFLTIVRSLGRHGLEVHSGWCPRDAVAARSRYITVRHDLPSPGGSTDTWQPALLEVLEREQFDLVLPTNDPTLIPLQRHRARFGSVARISLLNDHAFDVVFDKIKTRALAESLGVPLARGRVIETVSQLDEALGELGFPVVIKPRASYSPEDLEDRAYVRRSRDANEARSAVEELLRRGDVLVEENVSGTGCGVELLAADGQILMAFQHERLHEPPEGGQSSYRRSVPLHTGLHEAAAKLVAALDYTGVAMVEFKLDTESGQWALIEINGRFWGSLPLAVASGADFPVALWEMLVHGRRSFPSSYRADLFARNLRSDLKWLWTNSRADRSDPTLATRRWPEVVAETANLIRGRERSDTFARDDPAPAIGEIKDLAAMGTRALSGRLRTAAQRIPAVRRRSTIAARRALESADDIVFVCLGNIYRSPFAAAWAARRLGSDKRFRSAGLISVSGCVSPALARQIAQEFGVDLNGHRSVTLDDEMVSQAEALFVFDEGNRQELLRRHPSARAKIHLVGALSDARPLFVRDPVGGDSETVRAAYDRIAGLLFEGVSSSERRAV